MISERMQRAINAQINAEMWSAYLYLSMSMDAADKGLKGISHWYRQQFAEEQQHAMKFADYLASHSVRVSLTAIDGVRDTWASAEEMFAQTVEHERNVTKMIYNLCDIATEEHDYATMNMLTWFVNEQIEEEQTALYKRAEEILNEKAASLWIQDMCDLVVMNPALDGFTFYSTYVLDMSTIGYK